MPNWCECDLYLRGGNIAKVLDAIKGEQEVNSLKKKEVPLDFEKIIPMPATLHISSPPRDSEKEQAAKNERLYGAPTWYEWAHKNWGTKWNACEAVLISQTLDGAKLTFSTAWAPPIPVIKRLSELFPSTLFTLNYFEQGMAFQGKCTVKNGEVLANLEKPYHGPRGG